jgi:hypothetical protein
MSFNAANVLFFQLLGAIIMHFVIKLGAMLLKWEQKTVNITHKKRLILIRKKAVLLPKIVGIIKVNKQ